MTARPSIFMAAVTAAAVVTIVASAVLVRMRNMPDSDYNALLDLAALQNRLGLLDDAEGNYAAALHGAPDSVYAALKLADIRYANGDGDGAMELYKGILAAHPDCPPAEYNMGVILWHRKRYAEAGEYLGPFIDKYGKLLPTESANARFLLSRTPGVAGSAE